MGQRLRIVFFGTADFAIDSIDALLKAGHEVAAVITQPDRPSGRGLQLVPSPVKRAALERDLRVLQPKRARSEKFIERIEAIEPDLLAVAAFGQILPQRLLDAARIAPVNVHGSLLPRFRGASPIQRAIMAGDAITGVTTMWMDAGLDTGDILLMQQTPIEPGDTSGSLFPALARIGAELLVRTVEGLAEGTIERRPQWDSEATLAPPIRPEETHVNWALDARQIDCLLRGLSPKPGLFASMRSKRVKLWAAAPAEPTALAGAPGELVQICREPAGLLVQAGAGSALLIQEVQAESGKRMDARSWARGLRLAPGDRFDTLA